MLAGRRVVVAGAGGIGAAVARRAVAEGAAVHLMDIDGQRVAELSAELGCTSSSADLCRDHDVQQAFSAAAQALDGIDALVAIAGGSGRRLGDGPVHTLTAEAVLQTVRLNLLPPVLTLGAFVNAGGPAPRSAVLIGSVLARHPQGEFQTHAYAAAKAGIEGLAVAAAATYAEQGIAVNVVAPGLTRTPMSARAQADPTVSTVAAGRQPLCPDGFVEPDQVAQVCCAVLAAPTVTGQVIAVDGGWSVR